ncbi:MAG: hypothetical protein R3264_17000, partial [Anaerolineae bacterium]|nr:hypothetical protein [Anaerolineae bacterium]
MSTYSEAHYWLALINESNLKLNIIKPIIQRWCLVDNRPLAEIFSLSPLEWATMFGLEDAEVEQVLAAQQKLERQAGLVKQWQAEGIEPLIRTDPRYPKRLIHALAPAQQPLVLWARGTLSLLDEPV